MPGESSSKLPTNIRDLDGVPFAESKKALLLIDESLTYVDANQRALDLLHYSRDRLIGMQPKQLMELMDESEYEGAHRLFRELGEAAGFYLLRTGSGEGIEVFVHAVANVSPGFHLAELELRSG